jgi:hypothetical protein
MAGPAPKTRGWHARENAHEPEGFHVIVGGQVQVSATNKHPRLTETPERDPKNLGLNLTIDESGEGAQVVVWKAVHFHKEVEAGAFDNVIVRWDVGRIADFPILDDDEYAAKADAAMKTLNAKQAGKGKAAKPAGKKPAAKTAAKKAAPKKKAAAKKKPAKAKKAPTKKAAKKSAKKSSKKSGLKKLVRRLVKKLTPAKKKKRR